MDTGGAGGSPVPLESDLRQPKSQMDAMSREELLQHSKKQLVLLQRVKSRCDEIRSKNATLESNLRSKESELNETKSKLEANETETVEIQQRFSHVEVENASLTRKVLDLNEELECTQMKQVTAEATFSCLREEVTKLQAENKALESERSVLITARENTVLSLRTLKETLNEKHAQEMSELAQRLCETDSENERLEQVVRNLGDELLTHKQTMDGIEERNVKSVVAFTNQNGELTDLCNGLKEEMERLRLKLSESELRLVEREAILEQELIVLREQCEQMRQELLSKDELLEVERMQFANLKAEKESVESDLTQVRSKEAESENSMQLMRLECERLKEELSDLRANAALEGNEELKRIRCENEALTVKVHELKKTNKDYDDLRHKIQELRSREDVLVSEKNSLLVSLQDCDVLKQELEELKSKEALFKAEQHTSRLLQRECDVLRKELEGLRSKGGLLMDCELQTVLQQKKELEDQLSFVRDGALNLALIVECVNECNATDETISEMNVANVLHDCIEKILSWKDGNQRELRMMGDKVCKVERDNASLEDVLKPLFETFDRLDAKVTALEDAKTVTRIPAACQTIEEPNICMDVDIQVDVAKVGQVDASTECDSVSCDTGKCSNYGHSEILLKQEDVGCLNWKLNQCTALLRMMRGEIVAIVRQMKEVVNVIKDFECKDGNLAVTFEHLEEWMLSAGDEDIEREDDETIVDLQKLGNGIGLLPDVLRKWYELSRMPVSVEKPPASKDTEGVVGKYKAIAVKAKKEAAEMKKKFDSLNSEISSLRKDKVSMEENARSIGLQLNEERQKHKTTMSNLEQHRNLISLEIADYERHACDLGKQLADKDALSSALERDIAAQLEKIHALQVQIGQLESQYKQSEDRGEQLKAGSVKLRKDIADLQKEEMEWKGREVSLLVQFESTSQEVENYKVQLADVTADNQKLQSTNGSMQEAHQKVVRLLEARIRSLNDEIGKIRVEYDGCLAEYESYKVRVHSVLKQQKSKLPAETTLCFEMSLEEKVHLEKTIETLQARMQEFSAQYAAVQTENETLQEEHCNLLQRHNKLAANLAEQESTWRQRLEKLQFELKLEQQEHAELMRHIQSQEETHGAALKRKIDALQEVHQMEVQRLQDQLGAIEVQNLKLQKEVAQGEVARNASKDDEQLVDIFNMERQEGEGSEFTDSQKFGLSSPITTFLPLEQLLGQDEMTSISSVNAIEVEKLEGQLTISTRKIEHLTEILHESEAANARMTEQNRVLKEEIRRLERNQEREKHMANMEYLKNVIVKFISLSASDERERLVPVLTTLLRLSPLEEQQILAIAKGAVETTMAAANASGSWSSYLPLPRWPGSY